jgi:glycosyltransferase involved in cell wall biosynthesis
MKSIHIIGSKHSGGAEMFYLRLVNAIHEAGHDVEAVNRPRSMVAAQLDPGIEQHHVGMYNVRDPLSRILIRRIIESRHPDIVQTYMGRATRLTRVPKEKETLHVSRLGGFYKLDGYQHADAWVGNTRSICDYLRENGFPTQRVFHIPNFVPAGSPTPPENLGRIRKYLDLPEDALVILGAGRFMEKKGFRYLIEALSHLPEAISGRPLHLVIIGAGPEEKNLVSYADQLGLSSRIHWGGWQTDPGPYYEMADVFVCPSLHEPLGNVILESWSYGVPVISTQTHGARELIQDGINGLLVPCGDARALARVLESSLGNDRDFLEKLSTEGLSRVTLTYSKESVVRSYLDLYDDLIALGRRR